MMTPDYFILQKHVSNSKRTFFSWCILWLIKIVTIR